MSRDQDMLITIEEVKSQQSFGGGVSVGEEPHFQ